MVGTEHEAEFTGALLTSLNALFVALIAEDVDAVGAGNVVEYGAVEIFDAISLAAACGEEEVATDESSGSWTLYRAVYERLPGADLAVLTMSTCESSVSAEWSIATL